VRPPGDGAIRGATGGASGPVRGPEGVAPAAGALTGGAARAERTAMPYFSSACRTSGSSGATSAARRSAASPASRSPTRRCRPPAMRSAAAKVG
jgi:hypothetical protein